MVESLIILWHFDTCPSWWKQNFHIPLCNVLCSKSQKQ